VGKRSTVAIFLLAAGTAWNGGNIGPAVAQLTSEFSVSLSSVGLLSGTVLFGALVAASLATPKLADALGAATGAKLSAVLCGAGNVVCAVGPTYGWLFAGRIVAGAGLGISLVLGPAVARAAGGVRLLGVFGAGIMLGVAAALGIGGVLADAGVDWRVAFAISAAVGFSSLPLLPSRVEVAPAGERRPGDLRRILRSLPEWRLLLLFVAILAVPLVISAWFNHYLITEGGIAPGIAGLLAFSLFGLCTLVRIAGGREAGRGGHPVALAGVAPIVAGAGIALFAITPEIGGAVAAILLMGVGFALPYATMFDEGERLLEDDPVLSLTFLTVGANATPIWAIPVIGSALSSGDGKVAFLALAAFVAVAGVVNLRPAVRSGERATEPT
jgi:MFS transporter, DHA1 family, inner membrane transport protein